MEGVGKYKIENVVRKKKDLFLFYYMRGDRRFDC